jgi:hypothetical protein
MPGQINRSNCAPTHLAMVWAVESGASVVVADLTRTDLRGHAATVMLVSMQARAAKAGAQLRVAAAQAVQGSGLGGGYAPPAGISRTLRSPGERCTTSTAASIERLIDAVPAG